MSLGFHRRAGERNGCAGARLLGSSLHLCGQGRVAGGDGAAVEEEAVVVVVGHPRSLDGSRGPAVLAAEEEATLLEGLLEQHGIRVELFDERLTTVSAHQQLRAGGVKGRNQRAVVDQTAAAVMLMAWLDGRRAAR